MDLPRLSLVVLGFVGDGVGVLLYRRRRTSSGGVGVEVFDAYDPLAVHPFKEQLITGCQ